MNVSRILVFGDNLGIPQLLRHISSNIVCGIVVAEIRPQQHEVVRKLTLKMNLPFTIQPRHNSELYPTFVGQVRSLKPDLIIVHSYSMILRSEILNIPKYGAVNMHYALLPKNRGANPIQWAIINGETESGVTMHYMDEGIDTGDIIAQRRVPIYINDTWVDALARINAETDNLLENEMPKLLAGTNTRKPQDESCAEKNPRRHPEDGLIDWQQSPTQIYNMIRALVKPLLGAFYYDNSGQRITLDNYLTLQEVTKLKASIVKLQCSLSLKEK